MPKRWSAMLICLCVAALPGVAQEQQDQDLVVNGSFEEVTEHNPSHWSLATHGNDANLTAVELPDGTHALKLECTRFQRGWVIAAQDGVVGIKQGQWYRLTFRARAENLRGGCSVAASRERSRSSTSWTGRARFRSTSGRRR